MLQEIIVLVIVAASLAAAVTALVRRFRSKNPGCDCDRRDCTGCGRRPFY